nr:hypothetical protein [Tanacetum cinerariifolium]
ACLYVGSVLERFEMPAFYKKPKGRKKFKTSETTSGSAQGGFNLNDEADKSEEETQEHRQLVVTELRRNHPPPLVRFLHLLIW